MSSVKQKSSPKAKAASRRQRTGGPRPRKQRRHIPQASAQTLSLFRAEGPVALQSPIPQTSSWRLIVPSIRLWYANYNTSIVLFVLPMMVMLLGSLISSDGRSDTRTLLGLGVSLGGFLWNMINVPTSYYLQVQAINGRTPGVRQTYRNGLRLIPRLAGLGALVTALTIGGLLLLIVPGIIIIRRYLLSPYYMIDENLGIREAMRRSAEDSKPVSMYIWGVFALYIFVYIFLLYLFTAISPTLFSVAAASLLSNLYAFAPALRYKEVGQRKTAVQPVEV
jgi:hypothetical protein